MKSFWSRIFFTLGYNLIGIFILFFTQSCTYSESEQKNSSELNGTKEIHQQNASSQITLFLCGDVMTGRGIDQVLPFPGDPTLYESYMKTAEGYVDLAEEVNGPISKPVDFSYIWGDALTELDRINPDARIINLETTITKSNDFWPGKQVLYRMHPDNIKAITSAKIDFCSLANNHILDWNYNGLIETLETLEKANVKFAGAGLNIRKAETPVIIEIPNKGRIIIFSFGSPTSGVPLNWAAKEDKPGVNLLLNFSEDEIRDLKESVDLIKQQGDIVIASIHWGSNWGYDIPKSHGEFAKNLIDKARVDIIHGHSSHHPRPIEVYKGKLILYGCGDFINDYEGIGGYEQYRDDLTLMYFATVDPTKGKILNLKMVPMQIKKFKLNYANNEDAKWLQNILNRECTKFGTQIAITENNNLVLKW
ncbi:MAG: CapA family protein [Ignavibacterium sp.]|nr:MAG: CapA family protein [Ignavibacterium sp.]